MSSPKIPPLCNSPLYNSYNRRALNFTAGLGPYLYTSTGEEYLDFTSGVAVTGLGHAHPYLVSAIEQQAQKLWHVSNLFTIESQERLASRLCAISFADKVFFANSGAEAVECAIKTARRYYFAQGIANKNVIVSFSGAFHGRSLATLAATGNEKYLEGFDPRAPGFVQLSPRSSVEVLSQELQAIAPTVAGVIIEPIQGEGGVNVISKEMLQFLRNFCDANDALLIFDEVQTGIGRTGYVFAYEQFGIKPDIMALAKGLGGGFPIGACLSTQRAACGIVPGTHGSTFGGNLLAMAVANAVLDIILQPDFLVHVTQISARLFAGLQDLALRYKTIIGPPQGRGLLLGLPVKIASDRLIAACQEQKLLTLGCGNNLMRILPPLNITSDHVDEALQRLNAACKNLENTGLNHGGLQNA